MLASVFSLPSAKEERSAFAYEMTQVTGGTGLKLLVLSRGVIVNTLNARSPQHRENRERVLKNPGHGKHREFGNFAKTQGIVFAQVVNPLSILKILRYLP